MVGDPISLFLSLGSLGAGIVLLAPGLFYLLPFVVLFVFLQGEPAAREGKIIQIQNGTRYQMDIFGHLVPGTIFNVLTKSGRQEETSLNFWAGDHQNGLDPALGRGDKYGGLGVWPLDCTGNCSNAPSSLFALFTLSALFSFSLWVAILLASRAPPGYQTDVLTMGYEAPRIPEVIRGASVFGVNR